MISCFDPRLNPQNAQFFSGTPLIATASACGLQYFFAMSKIERRYRRPPVLPELHERHGRRRGTQRGTFRQYSSYSAPNFWRRTGSGVASILRTGAKLGT